MTKLTDRVKKQAKDTIDARNDQFVELAREIHAHPELAFTEEHAAARLTEVLAEEGFAVRLDGYGLPTAFTASAGTGPLHITFCAEYDALPDIGHACGHNLIAGAAVAAATGLQKVVDDIGLTVSVIGTPGEELFTLEELPPGVSGPGKALMLEAGAFDEVHAALMIHPAPVDVVDLSLRAVERQTARFSITNPGADLSDPAVRRVFAEGRLLQPQERRLLEDALHRSITSIHDFSAALPAVNRIAPVRMSGCFGRQRADARADVAWFAPTLAEAMRVREAVRRCFERAAAQTGVAVDLIDYRPYADMRHDPLLAARYRDNAEALGRTFPDLGAIADTIVAATDLGNVSYQIPCIHPMLGIGGTAKNHDAGFAVQAGTDEAMAAMLDGAVALAWTAVDAATDTDLNAYLRKAGRSHRTR